MSERPPIKLRLNVVSPERHPQQGTFPAAGVVLSEPMSRFRCNEKGCCCSGWDIPFRLEDFLRLHDRLDDADRPALTKGLKLILEPPKPGTPIDEGEQVLHSLKLAGVGDDKHCRFLGDGGGCNVHAKYGLEALPDLCVDFPSFGYKQPGDGPVELFFDPVCPEVLERLDESTEPLRLLHKKEPFGWATHDLRAVHAATPVHVAVKGQLLPAESLFAVRNACLEAFADPAHAPWETLAALLQSIRDLQPGAAPGPGWPSRPADLTPFLLFLNRCIDAHSAELLMLLFARFKRFVYAIDLKPVLERKEQLVAHLADWRPAFGKWLAPQEAVVRPLQARWLAHRFGSPFTKQRGELREAADAIAHLYGTSLRIAAALGATLEVPVDRNLYKVAIGASEFFYRSLHLPHESLPWFASEGDR